MLKCKLDEWGRLDILTPGVILRNGIPAINGTAMLGWKSHQEPLVDGWKVHYSAPVLGGGSYELEIHCSGEQAVLKWGLSNIRAGYVLDSFGLIFEQVENLHLYLRQGYMSWDGSTYVDPEALSVNEGNSDDLETGYAVTQLLPRFGEKNLVLGFERHDRFQQTFTFSRQRTPVSLLINTLWDHRSFCGPGSCEADRLLLLSTTEVEGGLRQWAKQVVAASPVPPRLPNPPLTGWSSWYNLYANISEENILEHLRAAQEVVQKHNLPLRVFQVDDGFTPEMGDWLDVRPIFPHGMKPLLDEIRKAGFIPGLWIAPFMVGNRSHLFQQHPDWVVRETVTDQPLVQASFYGEFRWHKRSEEYYILDTTIPEALNYLKTVIRTWHEEWGCDFFKMDFMYYGMANGPERAEYSQKGLSRVEIWRQAVECLRSAAGDSTLVGCGCPLFASIGLMDAVRIGSDIGVKWTGDRSAESLLRDQANRNFANGIFWQSDPDAVLLRERFQNLTNPEIRSLAFYTGMSGGVLMTSDHLGELSPRRLRLLRIILSGVGKSCDYPMLGKTGYTYSSGAQGKLLSRAVDPVIVQVRHPEIEGGLSVVFCINSSDESLERMYPLETLGFKKPLFMWEWVESSHSSERVDHLEALLPPHEGRLFFLQDQPITKTPERLP